MSSANILPPPSTFGEIIVDGQPYTERLQVFTSVITMTTNGQIFTSVPVTLAGVAPFLLKGLTRDILSNETNPPTGPPQFNVSLDRRFRFNLRNSSGLWIFDDRVVDTMCFGSGQFPYPLIPPIPIPHNGTIFYDVEDMGLGSADPDYFPYTIYFGFHGSYLYPSQTP